MIRKALNRPQSLRNVPKKSDCASQSWLSAKNYTNLRRCEFHHLQKFPNPGLELVLTIEI